MDLLNVHFDDGFVLEAILSNGEATRYISRVIKTEGDGVVFVFAKCS
jgi:hypothetical protein